MMAVRQTRRYNKVQKARAVQVQVLQEQVVGEQGAHVPAAWQCSID